MIIKVSLKGIGNISADIPSSAATRIFNNTTKNITDEILRFNIHAEATHVNSLVEPVNGQTFIKPTAPQLQHASASDIKFVIAACPKCGKLIIGNMAVGKTWKCHNCGTEIMIKNLIPGKYKCPNCGQASNFNVVGDLKIAKCKQCGSDIDMIYHEKKKMYLSINLIGNKEEE